MSVGAGTAPGVKRALAGWRGEKPTHPGVGKSSELRTEQTTAYARTSCRTVPKRQSISL